MFSSTDREGQKQANRQRQGREKRVDRDREGQRKSGGQTLIGMQTRQAETGNNFRDREDRDGGGQNTDRDTDR